MRDAVRSTYVHYGKRTGEPLRDLHTTFEDGYSRTATIDADTPIATFVAEEK